MKHPLEAFTEREFAWMREALAETAGAGDEGIFPGQAAGKK